MVESILYCSMPVKESGIRLNTNDKVAFHVIDCYELGKMLYSYVVRFKYLYYFRIFV